MIGCYLLETFFFFVIRDRQVMDLERKGTDEELGGI